MTLSFTIRWNWSLLALAILAGCGPSPSNTPTEPAAGTSAEPTAPAAERTIVAVAAASDLRYAFDEIAAEFERREPLIDVEPTYGSSGNFFAQLSNKAPFDVYLSADIDYPRRLAEEGLALPETQFQYAVGYIVVFVPRDSALDLETLGMNALIDPSVTKVAIANPQHAPYGRAAEAALKHFEIYDEVQPKLVLGENISQTAQFVESGAAEAGIIALSLAVAGPMAEKGRYWTIPAEAHPPLVQGGAIMSWVRDRPAADKLRTFLIGPEGRAILERFGFATPKE